jgi:hypothetical protein
MSNRKRLTHPVGVDFEDSYIVVYFANGRAVRVPLERYPWLSTATIGELAAVQFLPDRIYWRRLAQTIQVQALLNDPATTELGAGWVVLRRRVLLLLEQLDGWLLRHRWTWLCNRIARSPWWTGEENATGVNDIRNSRSQT